MQFFALTLEPGACVACRRGHAMAARRANTATVQDVVPILKSCFPLDLCELKYPHGLSEFISEHESLLRQLLAATPRVTQTLIEQALANSFQKLDSSAATAFAKQISGACAHVWQKVKQTTSGKKLSDDVLRLVQVARKHLQAPAIKARETCGTFMHRQARKLKKQASHESKAHEDELADLQAAYMLPATGSGLRSGLSRTYSVSSTDSKVVMQSTWWSHRSTPSRVVQPQPHGSQRTNDLFVPVRVVPCEGGSLRSLLRSHQRL